MIIHEPQFKHILLQLIIFSTLWDFSFIINCIKLY